ncbi:Fic family protein [Nesterenkonia pannonica]|uniref:Fic family protein n=1 Tax=Nesterenkonia pannonica TaxID=1548602 RepID=UPI002164D07D|nr:Fic family protein [Nesterenkonia pannonica]
MLGITGSKSYGSARGWGPSSPTSCPRSTSSSPGHVGPHPLHGPCRPPGLLRVAVAHAQFETIHPFVDGNERTGMALSQAMLRCKDVTRNITVPISASLLTDTERYFHALTAFRHGDAGPIAERFVHAALFAAETGKTLVDELSHHMNTAAEQLHGTRRSSQAWKILSELLAHPVTNARFLQDHLGISGPGAQRALEQLTEHGILRETTGRDRNRIWQHDGILDTLDNYAEEVRRHRHG